MSFTVLTMSRGDETRLKDWITYHAALGFDEIVIILDNPIDDSERIIRETSVDASVAVRIESAVGEYFDGLTQAERWERVQAWRVENKERLTLAGVPVVDPQTERQHMYFEPLLEEYGNRPHGWLALIDVDEYLVLPGGRRIDEIVSMATAPRLRFLNFNFDMNSHNEGAAVTQNTRRWSREDIVAYGGGWDKRVKTLARYDALHPLVSVHAISRGSFQVLDPEVGRLHHYRWPDQGIGIPYSVIDKTIAGK